MFSELYEGKHGRVVWFAGVADGVVHVTLCDENRENIFYDFMTSVNGSEDFEKQLKMMISKYLDNITIKLLESGKNDEK